jgi:hypothetical protein
MTEEEKKEAQHYPNPSNPSNSNNNTNDSSSSNSSSSFTPEEEDQVQEAIEYHCQRLDLIVEDFSRSFQLS